MTRARLLALPAALSAVALIATACGSGGSTSTSPRGGGQATDMPTDHSMSGMNDMPGMAGSTDTGLTSSSGGYTLWSRPAAWCVITAA